MAKIEVIKLKMILGFHSEIEELEFFLWLCSLYKKTNRLEVWTDTLISTAPEFINSSVIIEYRKRLSARNLNINFFIRKYILKFYKRSSTLNGHKIKFSNCQEVTPAIFKTVLEDLGLLSHQGHI